MTTPQRTSLNISDPHVLLAQLTDDVDPAELLQVDSAASSRGARSVHSWAIWSLLWSETSGEAMGWFKVCNRLIDLTAPLAEPHHGNQVGPQLWASPWPDGNRFMALTLELVERYISDGWLDIHARRPGCAQPRPAPGSSDPPSSSGLMPLACAIVNKSSQLAQLFIRAGAPLDLGEVFAGEPPFDAIRLAQAYGDSETAAVATEALMQRRIQAASTTQSAATQSATQPTTQSGGAQRRRSTL